MKIYFATWTEEDNQGETLTKAKAKKRLMSYFFLREFKFFKEYAKTGRVKKK